MFIEEQPMISGKSVSSSGNFIEVVSPSTGEIIGKTENADAQTVDTAFKTAQKAQNVWGRKNVRERAAMLNKIADAVEADQEALAHLLVTEVGKPIHEARGEVGAVINYFKYYANLVVELRGESLEIGEQSEVWLRREPIGIVAAILPWNYPAALVARKAAPALAAGNAIIIKPHETTPLSAFWVARKMIDAGLDAGLISILPGTGPETGNQLAADARTNLVTMTGSVVAGKAILAAAAPNLTPVSLELGGKAPLIVMPSADVELAAKAAAESRFANNGQVCICAERIFVHKSVEAKFTELFIDHVKQLRVDDPFAPESDLGPKVSSVELEKVKHLVDEAVKEGANVLYEGKIGPDMNSEGFWMAPVVLNNVDDSMRLMKQEIFGPVAPITSFDDEDEVVSRANDSEYGLSAYLFSKDHAQIMRMIRNLDSGEIYVNRVGPEDNAGYHTGLKNSGLGGDDGPHGFEAYWRKKTVYLDW